MRWYAQEIICVALRISLIPWILREVYAKWKVTIINYHNPEPHVFERHMRFYQRNYNIVSLKRVSAALSSGDFSQLPKKSLVITIDDGSLQNLNLIPIIRRFNAPVVIYVVAGIVSTNRHFWFTVPFHHRKEKRQMRMIADSVRRDHLRTKYGHTDEFEYDTRQGLNIDELNALLNAGAVIGSHSMFHPYLDRCDRDVATFELRESKRFLECKLQVPIVDFAYPSGLWNKDVRALCGAAGYETVRTIDPGWVEPKSDPLALPDFGISDDAGINKAVVQTSGLWDLMKGLIQRLIFVQK